MNYRREEVLDARADSCTWILQHHNYQKWLADDHGLLWIQGKPGSGKSTLMKRIFKVFGTENRGPGRIHLAFFFHRRGVQLQHTPLGMFRTMLHQLLSQVPSASADFLSLCEEKRRFQGDVCRDWEWREPELRRVLKSSLVSAAKTCSLVIFVDALDEAGEDSARSVISYLHEVNEQLLQSKHATSICFACRHYPIVRTSDGIQICVEDENFKDISAYALSELRRQIRPRDQNLGSDHLNELEKRISSKASGVFLWVYLVIPTIAKQYNEGRPLEEILKALEKAPSDLKTIYQHILGLVDPTFQMQTLHLMEWICFAESPLSLTELRFALAMDDSSIHPYQESAQESTGFVKSDMQMKDMIIGLSGGLAEVKFHSEGRREFEREVYIVQFIHQSVNDFLLKDGFRLLNQSSAGNAIGQGHDRLAKSCINYLKLGEVERAASSSSLDESSLEADLPFLRYSTESWSLHAEKAESWNISQSGLIQRFQWPTAQYFPNWIKLYRTIDRYESRCLQANTTLMHVAAASNLESIVTTMLDSNMPLEAKDAEGNTVLHDAARWGHKKIVHMLLNAGANVNASTNEGQTPLERAGARGHAEVVKLLLENGVEVNQNTGWSGSTLQSAALMGWWVTVKLLLDNGADINAHGGDYGNALQAAAYGENDAVVKLLLDRGADINAQGGDYGNALQAAAYGGSEAIIKLLLDQGADINAQGGYFGNALQAAAAAIQDSYAIVKLLLNRGADINTQGGYYGNTLQAAAYRGSEAIVKLLLNQGADINTQGGYFGNALQAAAAAIQDSYAIVKLLLNQGADINTQGGYFGNALQAAAYGENDAVVKLLLNQGADINTQGGGYGNALQAAAIEGSETIVKLLLDRGADINKKDSQGRLVVHLTMRFRADMVKYLLSLGARPDWTYTDQQGCSALHFAASGGSVEAVKLILSSGIDIDINLSDTQGWTPLHWACRNGDVSTVQLLIDSGADFQNETKQSWTPLDVAIFCGNDSLIPALSQLRGSSGIEMKQNVFALAIEHYASCSSCFHVSAIPISWPGYIKFIGCNRQYTVLVINARIV
jgi:ankyrin repeat protein